MLFIFVYSVYLNTGYIPRYPESKSKRVITRIRYKMLLY